MALNTSTIQRPHALVSNEFLGTSVHTVAPRFYSDVLRTSFSFSNKCGHIFLNEKQNKTLDAKPIIVVLIKN